MPISTFNFSSTHSYNDHPTVARARETINGLPQYAGYVRLGDQFSIAGITNYIEAMKRFATSEERQIETRCADGQNRETVDKNRENLRTIRAYIGSLETIRDYMSNYSRCGC